MSNEDEEDEYSQYFHYDNDFVRSIIDSDSENNIFIDWMNFPGLDPTQNINFKLVPVSPDIQPWSVFNAEAEFTIKLKPRRVYWWDVANNEFQETADRTDRIDRDEVEVSEENNTSSGYEACDLKSFYLIKSINGNSLPWTEYDDGQNSLTWESGTLAKNADGTWKSYIFSAQVIDGVSKDVETDRTGTWTCNDEQGTITFSGSGTSNTGTVNEQNGNITLPQASYTIVYY